SNSVRLVEVALENGARDAHRIDDRTEIDDAWLEGAETVGVTSGASVPDALGQDVLDYLHERGIGDTRSIRTAEESLVFALPPELRRDLKAAGQDSAPFTAFRPRGGLPCGQAPQPDEDESAHVAGDQGDGQITEAGQDALQAGRLCGAGMS